MNNYSASRIGRLLGQIDRNYTSIDGYRQMLTIAQTRNMEYEQGRIPKMIAELERDIEDVMDELVQLGYVPA